MVSQLQARTLRVNGTELAYVEQGTGEPVVFVHGGLGDYRSWLFQIEPFAQHYHVVAYSRRYHFPNDASTAGEYAAADHRDDLAALVKALGLAPAHLVASSYGAYISILVAVTYPALVRSMVLGEPPLPMLFGPEAVRAAAAQVEPSRRAFDRGDDEQAVRVFIDSVVGEGGLDHLPPPARQVLLENAPEFRAEVHTAPERYYAPLNCEDTSRISVPVLLLNGESSPPFFHQMTDELERCLARAERAVIPHASHGMQSMNPSAYNESVLTFLAKH